MRKECKEERGGLCVESAKYGNDSLCALAISHVEEEGFKGNYSREAPGSVIDDVVTSRPCRWLS